MATDAVLITGEACEFSPATGRLIAEGGGNQPSGWEDLCRALERLECFALTVESVANIPGLRQPGRAFEFRITNTQ
jgi:hypothetical protein